MEKTSQGDVSRVKKTTKACARSDRDILLRGNIYAFKFIFKNGVVYKQIFE